jgi:hypothetical protein
MNHTGIDPANGVPNFNIKQIEEEVRRRLANRLDDFRLVVRDEGLILHGRAGSYYTKQLAQEAVREITKMPILANRITVAATMPQEA